MQFLLLENVSFFITNFQLKVESTPCSSKNAKNWNKKYENLLFYRF